MPVDIVTGDRDLFQLVDDEADVRVLYTARGVGKHERVTNDVLREKYDVNANQYAAFATLRGDSSDGLPGVAGVGDKTAAVLLNRFGDLQGIVAAAADPESEMSPGPRRRILDAADYPRGRPDRGGGGPPHGPSRRTTRRCRRRRATPRSSLRSPSAGGSGAPRRPRRRCWRAEDPSPQRSISSTAILAEDGQPLVSSRR